MASDAGGASATGGAGTGGMTTSPGSGIGGASTGTTFMGSAATGGTTTGGRTAMGGTTGGTAIGGGGSIGTAYGTCSASPPLTGGTRYCEQSTSGNYGSYRWRLWTIRPSGCLTTYSDGAFSASWDNSGDFLAGVGLEFDKTRTPQELGTFSADFAESRTGSAESPSAIGIYGWSESPGMEFIIVEDSFQSPMPKPAGGSLVGTLEVDGGVYDIYKHMPRTTGAPVTSVTSIRQQYRSCGHISISTHFIKWAELGMPVGKLQELWVAVLSPGGTGSVSFSTAKIALE